MRQSLSYATKNEFRLCGQETQQEIPLDKEVTRGKTHCKLVPERIIED